MKLKGADCLVCMASWEPRFVCGTQENLKVSQAKACVMFYLEEFIDKTSENIEQIQAVCREAGIEFIKVALNYKNPLQSRLRIQRSLEIFSAETNLLIDISTMTREAIWFSLDIISNNKIKSQYIYWAPEKTAEWTTKDSEEPRLVVGRAGISKYGRPTLVAVTTGFDKSRVDQMINYFEPEKTILLVQEGEQQHNHINNIQRYMDYNLGGASVKSIPVNSFSQDCGLSVISQNLEPYIRTHNIVLASFGPKLSSIAIHYFQKEYPEIALAYTPAMDFNSEYSKGTGDYFCDDLL